MDRLFAGFAQFRWRHDEGLAAEFSMVGNGEAMRFVPDALDQAGDVGRRGQDEWGAMSGGVDSLFLLAFGFG